MADNANPAPTLVVGQMIKVVDGVYQGETGVIMGQRRTKCTVHLLENSNNSKSSAHQEGPTEVYLLPNQLKPMYLSDSPRPKVALSPANSNKGNKGKSNRKSNKHTKLIHVAPQESLSLSPSPSNVSSITAPNFSSLASPSNNHTITKYKSGPFEAGHGVRIIGGSYKGQRGFIVEQQRVKLLVRLEHSNEKVLLMHKNLGPWERSAALAVLKQRRQRKGQGQQQPCSIQEENEEDQLTWDGGNSIATGAINLDGSVTSSFARQQRPRCSSPLRSFWSPLKEESMIETMSVTSTMTSLRDTMTDASSTSELRGGDIELNYSKTEADDDITLGDTIHSLNDENRDGPSLAVSSHISSHQNNRQVSSSKPRTDSISQLLSKPRDKTDCPREKTVTSPVNRMGFSLRRRRVGRQGSFRTDNSTAAAPLPEIVYGSTSNHDTAAEQQQQNKVPPTPVKAAGHSVFTRGSARQNHFKPALSSSMSASSTASSTESPSLTFGHEQQVTPTNKQGTSPLVVASIATKRPIPTPAPLQLQTVDTSSRSVFKRKASASTPRTSTPRASTPKAIAIRATNITPKAGTPRAATTNIPTSKASTPNAANACTLSSAGNELPRGRSNTPREKGSASPRKSRQSLREKFTFKNIESPSSQAERSSEANFHVPKLRHISPPPVKRPMSPPPLEMQRSLSPMMMRRYKGSASRASMLSRAQAGRAFLASPSPWSKARPRDTSKLRGGDPVSSSPPSKPPQVVETKEASLTNEAPQATIKELVLQPRSEQRKQNRSLMKYASEIRAQLREKTAPATTPKSVANKESAEHGIASSSWSLSTTASTEAVLQNNGEVMKSKPVRTIQIVETAGGEAVENPKSSLFVCTTTTETVSMAKTPVSDEARSQELSEVELATQMGNWVVAEELEDDEAEAIIAKYNQIIQKRISVQGYQATNSSESRSKIESVASSYISDDEEAIEEMENKVQIQSSPSSQLTPTHFSERTLSSYAASLSSADQAINSRLENLSPSEATRNTLTPLSVTSSHPLREKVNKMRASFPGKPSAAVASYDARTQEPSIAQLQLFTQQVNVPPPPPPQTRPIRSARTNKINQQHPMITDPPPPPPITPRTPGGSRRKTFDEIATGKAGTFRSMLPSSPREVFVEPSPTTPRTVRSPGRVKLSPRTFESARPPTAAKDVHQFWDVDSEDSIESAESTQDGIPSPPASIVSKEEQQRKNRNLFQKSFTMATSGQSGSFRCERFQTGRMSPRPSPSGAFHEEHKPISSSPNHHVPVFLGNSTVSSPLAVITKQSFDTSSRLESSRKTRWRQKLKATSSQQLQPEFLCQPAVSDDNETNKKQNSLGASWQDILHFPSRTLTRKDILCYQSSASASQSQALRNCYVCAKSFRIKDVVRTLPCHHSFHTGCIDKFLFQQAECPMCKHPAVVLEI